MKEGYDRGLSAKRVRSGPLNFVEIQRGRLRLRLPPLPPLGHGGGAGGLDRVPAADGLSFSSPLPLREARLVPSNQAGEDGQTALRSAEPLGLGDRSGRLTHS